MKPAAAAVLVLSALSLPLGAQAEPGAPQSPAARARELLEAAEEVMAEVAAIRGWEFRRPVAKDVRTEEQLRAFIEKKLFEEEMGGGELERTETWLKLIGLMPPDLDFRETVTDVLLNQVGGFYDPEENAFYMMAEAARFPDVVNRMLMAHELCHALDDQYVDLDGLMHPEGRELTEDEEYAIGAVVEGSATALMFVWFFRKAAAGEVDGKEMMAMQKAEMERSKTLLGIPRYFTLIVANYMVGRGFVTKGADLRAMGEDSGGAIREVAEDPPRSTEQVLHPEKYWDPDARDEPVRVANEADVVRRIERATGREVVHRDTLGELVCAITALDRSLNMTLMVRPSYWTNKYAEGWGGDRLYLVADGARELADAGVVWVTAWDTEQDREEFVAGMRRARGESPGFAVAEGGRLAVLAFGSCKDAGLDLEGILAAVRFSKDGEAWSARSG